MLSDKKLNNLENKVNSELSKNFLLVEKKQAIAKLLNKLCVHKRPNISCIAEFQLQLNKNFSEKRTYRKISRNISG